MRIQHFVLTPFCIRNPEALRQARGGGWVSRRDPLDREFLNGRLQLLEITAAATLQGQSCRDFTWIVIIDPALPATDRERVAAICGDAGRVVLHEYNATDRWDSAKWLEPYLEGTPDFLLTTHLDDDDAFSRTYIEEVQKAARAHVAGDGPALIRTFGCKQIWQWNRIYTKKTPLGTRSDWAGTNKVTSCGFSVLCKYPELSLTVLELRHKRAENYLDFTSEPGDETVVALRSRIEQRLASMNLRLQDCAQHFGFEDLAERTGPVVIGAHVWNVQTRRLRKKQLQPATVTGPDTFPQHSLNWDAARSYVPEFRPSSIDVMRTRFGELAAYVRQVFS